MARVFPFLAALTLIIFMAACDSERTNQSRKMEAAEQKETGAVPVEVVSVRLGEIYQPIHAIGQVLASKEAQVAAKISGRIQSIFVDEGDRVEKNSPLFLIDKTDLILAQDAAKAQLAVGEASLAEARIASERLYRDRERFQRLFENKATSQQKFEEVQSAYLTAQARVEFAQANLKALSANLSLANSRLDDAEIRAPLGGFVVRRAANAGEFIAPGVPIIFIMNHDPVKLEIDVSEMHSPRIRQGTPVEATFDALPGKTITSVIARVVPRVNPQSRTLKVEINIPNPNNLIKPGMFCRVTIKTERLTNVPVLPLRAVLRNPAGEPYVLVSRDNRALARKLTLGLSNDNLVEIRDGVTPKELILVTGNFGLEEGTLLAPRQVNY